MKISVGIFVFNLTKYDEIQITDISIIKNLITGGYLLQTWVKKRNDKNKKGKIQYFIKSTKTNSRTSCSGTKSLPPVGDSFLYIETSGNDSGNDKISISFERTDIIPITNITLCHNRFSNLTENSLNSMGRFRIHLLLEDNTW